MRKLGIILVMMLTIIWTMPSITITESNLTSKSFPTEQAMEIVESVPKSLSANGILPEETAGNNTNKGLATETKDKLFYSDGEDLWSMDKEGTSKTRLKKEGYPVNLQILDDVIYYINEDNHHIYSITTDGAYERRISDDKAYSINIYNHRLYFMDRYNQLYITSMSLDGKDKQVIKEIVANDMMIYNDQIYYITRSGDIGKMRIDGAKDIILETGVIQFDVSKTGIYFTYDPRISHKPKGLYHLDFEENNETQLLEETPYSFNVHKDKIYYNHPTKLSLYSMNIDGRGRKEITGVNSTQINLAGNYIFYKNLEDNKKIYRVNLDGTNRISLQGKTLVTNVVDLTKEINDLQEKEIVPKLERTYNRARDIISEIIEINMSDYEKARVIHDYVVNSSSYDLEAAEQFLNGAASDANAFTAYGILINQRGVCQGYAEAMQILLSLAGIETDLVIGEAADDEGGSVSHMWNIVRIDGEYYMLDATWDDPVGPRDIILHDYFLVDSETLKKTHTWAYDEYPPCNNNF